MKSLPTAALAQREEAVAGEPAASYLLYVT
jgi:hypothetical protein